MNTVLVTGAHGFLGRNVAACFAAAGYTVHGLGIGPWSGEFPADFGIHRWIESPVTLEALKAVPCRPKVVVHCAGSGSVGYSLAHPFEDFSMTVDTTAAVLEYMRTTAPAARLIYPSSAAVYGCRHTGPLREDFLPEPFSPYGFHKLMAEQLCLSAIRNFGLDCRIVRFFSLYGPGLRKQLLWDASRRLVQADGDALDFFGTGAETRDWLHVRDAAALMLAMAESSAPPVIVNGASGESHSVQEVITALMESLHCTARVSFNGQVREGDPNHLEADTSVVGRLGWSTKVPLQVGLKEYAEWFMHQKK